MCSATVLAGEALGRGVGGRLPRRAAQIWREWKAGSSRIKHNMSCDPHYERDFRSCRGLTPMQEQQGLASWRVQPR